RELPLERGRRPRVGEHVGYDAVHADLHGGDVPRAQPVLGAQIDERVDRRVRERARRIRLDGDARSEEMPAAAEALERLVEGPSAAEGRGLALAALDSGLGPGHALARELAGEA